MSPHGTTSRYVQGCRCAECKSANSAYLRNYRANRKKLASGVRVGKASRAPEAKVLDVAVAKVGQDFPALGALVRAGWTGAA